MLTKNFADFKERDYKVTSAEHNVGSFTLCTAYEINAGDCEKQPDSIRYIIHARRT